MKTLIAYASKYGCTEKYARSIKERLGGEVDLLDLKASTKIGVNPYQRVIIGGSIYIGKIQKEVLSFCNQNEDVLCEKELGVFICGMQDKKGLAQELHDNFSEKLLRTAKSKHYFGGELNLDRASFLDKLIMKKIAQAATFEPVAFGENLDPFIQEMNGN
jgi:menaquinone-dependent protoporphyrinogen oxidase